MCFGVERLMGRKHSQSCCRHSRQFQVAAGVCNPSFSIMLALPSPFATNGREVPRRVRLGLRAWQLTALLAMFPQVSALQQQLDAAQSTAAAAQRDVDAARRQAAEAQEAADAARRQVQGLEAELADLSAGTAESARSLQKLRDQARMSAVRVDAPLQQTPGCCCAAWTAQTPEAVLCGAQPPAAKSDNCD